MPYNWLIQLTGHNAQRPVQIHGKQRKAGPHITHVVDMSRLTSIDGADKRGGAYTGDQLRSSESKIMKPIDGLGLGPRQAARISIDTQGT